MKKLKRINEICSVSNDTIYETENGVYVRDIIIDAGIGEEVGIGHISDIHFNYCNDKDFEEADPVLMSTHKNRIWNANGETVAQTITALEILDDADQIVINGDTLDYISNGTMELMDTHIWNKIPGVVATVGGHELAIKMQGEIEETTTCEERMEIIKNYWRHDIFYHSKLVKNKVLIVAMLNDCAKFYDIQAQKLRSDLDLARQMGYAVLVFCHEPVATKNPEHMNFNACDAMLVGDENGFPKNFCAGITKGKKMAGNDECDEPTKEVYNIITQNADVIKGVFAAHNHSDMHVDIVAHNPDGTMTTITQYINNSLAYGKGHFMRIILK